MNYNQNKKAAFTAMLAQPTSLKRIFVRATWANQPIIMSLIHLDGTKTQFASFSSKLDAIEYDIAATFNATGRYWETMDIIGVEAKTDDSYVCPEDGCKANTGAFQLSGLAAYADDCYESINIDLGGFYQLSAIKLEISIGDLSKDGVFDKFLVQGRQGFGNR